MSVKNNVVHCVKTFPSDIKELISSFKDQGWKKNWTEKNDLIVKIGLKALAGLFILGGVALLIAFPFQAVAISAAGYGVATIVAAGVLRLLVSTMSIGLGAILANRLARLDKIHSMMNL